MFSDRSTSVREKRFLPTNNHSHARGQHSDLTLTDDHTLFLLNQERENKTRRNARSWFARLFRR